MKITYLKRRGGKTTKAIEECKKTGAILVVLNPMWKREIIRQYGLSEHMVMTHRQFLDKNYFDRLRGISFASESRMPEYVIDDVDWLLNQIPPFGSIRHITLSKPYSKRDCKKLGLPVNMIGKT